jgi:ABC-type glycerol-3-phosphate transport system substrate-binding protein
LVTPTRFPGEDVHPLDLDGQTVRFIHPWAGELGDQVAAIIADFNRTNLFNIEVEVIQAGSSNALTDIVAASLDQATRPQLAVASLDQIQYWQSISPVTVDVQPYIDDPEWGLQPDEIADLIPTYLNALRIDDKLLGLPATVDVNLLFYNQTWAKELGFSNPPVIPEDFRLQACRAAQANMEREDGNRDYAGTGGWLIDTQALTSLSWLTAFGARPSLADGSLLFSSDRSVDAFTYLRDLYDQDCAWFGIDPQPYEYFTDRLALLYSGSLGDILEQDDTNTRLGSKDDWTVMPYPSSDKTSVLVSDIQAFTILRGTPAEQLAAWLVIRWLAQPQNHAAIVKKSGSLPVNRASLERLGEFEILYPQWSDVAGWELEILNQPTNPDWLIARRLLEDFTWQAYQANITTTDLPDYLKALDDQLEELTR